MGCVGVCGGMGVGGGLEGGLREGVGGLEEVWRGDQRLM